MNAKFYSALFGASLVVSVPNVASASLIADAELSITEIRISSDVDASFRWLNDWLGVTQVETADTLSGNDGSDDDEIGNNFSLSSTAATTYTAASSSISVTDGENIGFGNGVFDLNLSSSMALTESDTSAFSEVFGMFENMFFTFDIDGGSLANVDIELDYSFSVDSTVTDGATYDLLLGSQLFLTDADDSAGDADSVDNMELDTFETFLDGSLSETGSGTLSISALLQAEKEYQLLAIGGIDVFGYSGEFDDEPPVEVLAPPTLALSLLAGLCMGFRRKS